ncbi:MAG: TonB-dependent receptor [Hyphomicrobiales bacterium]|nr:TonB-dependent receptor [Hyphomicrobiales bacterium]
MAGPIGSEVKITYRLSRSYSCVVVLIGLHLAETAYTQTPIELEPIIITASRFAENGGDVGRASTIIDKSEIENAQAKNLAQRLERVPGLTVTQSGGTGGNVSIFMRSANSDQRLVIIDGVRVDEFDEAATETTYRLTVTYMIPSTATKLRASYGTGTKAPTIQQRFEDSSFAVGNPDLAVETSRGFDIGIDQELLGGQAVLSATYFSSDIKNLISAEFDSSSGKFLFVNIDKAEIDGFELAASWFATDMLTFKGAYTWLDAGDATDGSALARRPHHAFNLSATLAPCVDWSVTARLVYIGERFNFSGESDLVDN